MATYKVKYGDTLMDVCYNTTGSLRALNDIMNANGFGTYTPQLEAGTTIEVPDVVYNSEAVTVANERPFSSASIPVSDLKSQMEQLEFILGDIGSIIYTFDGAKLAGKNLSLNAKSDIDAYISWGDGTPLERVKTAGFATHDYAAGTTGQIVVTFTGISGGGFDLTTTVSTHALFRSALLKVDLTNADAACPSGNWYAAFYRCEFLTEVVGSFAGKPNVYNVDSMFFQCFRLVSLPEQMFRGCPKLWKCNSMLSYCRVNETKMDYYFADCPALEGASQILYENWKVTSAVGMFANSLKIRQVAHTFYDNRLLSDVTDLFSGGEYTQDNNVVYLFSGCESLNPPPSIFDPLKHLVYFQYAFYGMPAATNESPYTVVNGQKVHLWERTPELGFSAPISHEHCFSDSPNFSDYQSIPESWGGPPKTEVSVKLRMWALDTAITADPSTFVAVIYLNDEILGYNTVTKDVSDRLVVDLPLQVSITNVEGLYATIYNDQDQIIGGSLALASDVAAPVEGHIYDTYYNAGENADMPSLIPIFAPNDSETPSIINTYFTPTYNVHIPSLGDYEVIGSEEIAGAVEIATQIPALGWQYYVASSSSIFVDLVQKLQSEEGIPVSALDEEGCMLTLSLSIEGYVMTAPAIKFNTKRGSIMPIMEFAYVPPP